MGIGDEKRDASHEAHDSNGESAGSDKPSVEPDGDLADAAPDAPPAPEDPSAAEPPPKGIAELCAAGVRFVQQKYGVPLDFTSDTLSLVDQYVRDARAEVIALPTSFDLVSSSIGAYFGEVVRRTYGGYWVRDAEPQMFCLGFSKVKLSFNPVGMMREALLRDAEEGWNAHLTLPPQDEAYVRDRMAAMSEVDEDEYYLPSTRFDAIALAFDAITGRMMGRGEGDKRFYPKDYES
ncbi:MAG: hypothetical protein U0174_18880 [Polyangiaceae bacterium]